MNEVQYFHESRHGAPSVYHRSISSKMSARYVPNGRISPDVRLACAIRWFAGGSAYDIMTTYGIGHSDTINSCWYVLDAINRQPSFDIAYPADHDKSFYDV